MKMTLQKGDLTKGLQAVRSAVGGKGSLAILSNVKFEVEKDSLVMMTSNIDTTIRTKVACASDGAFATTLPYAILASTAAKMPDGEIAFDYDKVRESVDVRGGSFKVKLNGRSAEDFPKLPADDGSAGVGIPCETLAKLLKSVAFAASKDDTRRTLKAALMSFKGGTLTMVATDGRRLAMNSAEVGCDASFERDVIMPSALHNELIRMLSDGEGDATFQVSGTQVSLTIGDTCFYTKLIDDTYPNYRQVIPNEDGMTAIALDRDSLIAMLDRVSIFASDEAHSVKLAFSTGKLTVQSANTEVGEAKDEQPVKYEGDRVEIMFNPQYLLEPAKVIDDDEITFMLRDGHSPVTIKSSDSFVGVVMPLRLN